MAGEMLRVGVERKRPPHHIYLLILLCYNILYYSFNYIIFLSLDCCSQSEIMWQHIDAERLFVSNPDYR